MATNVCIGDHRWRKRARRDRERYAGLLTGEDQVYHMPDPWEDDETEDFRRLVRKALDDLPPRQKQAVTLRIIEQKRPREAAGIMGITRGTVRSHLHHALRRLRERIEDPSDPLFSLNRFRTEVS